MTDPSQPSGPSGTTGPGGPVASMSWWQSAAILALAGGFFLRFQTVSTSYSGDHVDVHFRDWASLVGGGIAILFALIALFEMRGPGPHRRSDRFAISLIELIAGGVL